jgi:hypothetical protein
MMSGVSTAAGGTSVGTTCTSAAADGSFVATAFLATALRFLFDAFLPADFNFRVRIAFFFAALRFMGMGIPLVKRFIWRPFYNAYLRGVQFFRLCPSIRRLL